MTDEEKARAIEADVVETEPDVAPGLASPSHAGPPPEVITVLVNLLWLVPGVVGGSEESTTDALRDLAAELPDDLEVTLAVLGPFLKAHPDLADRYRCVVLDLDGDNKGRRVLAEQTWLASQAHRLRAHVVHHAGGVVPLRHPGKVVLTIHDLQPLDLPSNFSTLKRSYIRAMVGRSARAADLVCVPSEFTRSRVIELLGSRPDRVVVVPWSVPAARETGGQPTDDAAGGSDPAASTTSHDGSSDGGDSGSSPLPYGRYFLYPAITYPHKNHAVLLDAFARLVSADPDLGDVRLVLTGGEGPAERSVVARYFQPDLSGRVVRTGRVPADDLARLYSGAAAVVVPSCYEGFGLPVLEAMARGVPVIAARAGSLPEVAREEDLVDPDDVTGWAAAMHAVLDLSAVDRAARQVAGRVLAQRFGSQRTATALLDAYRSAAGAPTTSREPTPSTTDR